MFINAKDRFPLLTAAALGLTTLVANGCNPDGSPPSVRTPVSFDKPSALDLAAKTPIATPPAIFVPTPERSPAPSPIPTGETFKPAIMTRELALNLGPDFFKWVVRKKEVGESVKLLFYAEGFTGIVLPDIGVKKRELPDTESYTSYYRKWLGYGDSVNTQYEVRRKTSEGEQRWLVIQEDTGAVFVPSGEKFKITTFANAQMPGETNISVKYPEQKPEEVMLKP